MPQLMVVLGVTFTTSWQQDRLVQRELFDKKTSPVVPDYYDIEVDGFDGQVYGYWPAKKTEKATIATVPEKSDRLAPGSTTLNTI